MKRTYDLFLPKSVTIRDVLDFIEERGINNDGGDPIGIAIKGDEYVKPVTITIGIHKR